MTKITKKARFAAPKTQEKGEDRVYLFRMDGCHFCEELLQDTWPTVSKIIQQEHPSVKIIVKESNELDTVDPEMKAKLDREPIEGYPDLRMLKKNGSTSTFQGNRTVDELVKWIKQNVTMPHVPTPHPKKKKSLKSRPRVAGQMALQGGSRSCRRRRRRAGVGHTQRRRRRRNGRMA